MEIDRYRLLQCLIISRLSCELDCFILCIAVKIRKLFDLFHAITVISHISQISKFGNIKMKNIVPQRNIHTVRREAKRVTPYEHALHSAYH